MRSFFRHFFKTFFKPFFLTPFQTLLSAFVVLKMHVFTSERLYCIFFKRKFFKNEFKRIWKGLQSFYPQSPKKGLAIKSSILFKKMICNPITITKKRIAILKGLQSFFPIPTIELFFQLYLGKSKLNMSNVELTTVNWYN